MGCLFVGKPWSYGDKGSEKAFAIVCGKVLRPITMKTTKVVNSVDIVVKYYNAKGAWIRCRASGDTAALRAFHCLEKNDVVFACGELVTTHYKRRNGTENSEKILHCQFAFPADMVPLMIELSSSETLMNMMKEEYKKDFGEGFKEYCAWKRIKKQQAIQNGKGED